MWNYLPLGEGRGLVHGVFDRYPSEAGVGAVLAPGPAVWDAIAGGRLVAPLGLYKRDGNWALLWRTDQTSALHMSTLRWFQAEFAAAEAAAFPETPRP